ncbi:hypothetical protein [Winogradskyella sp. SYSU M77433]|uniref:hypothetical protein n=1 Tax=Winogradskyella sp. SYSU M77433 TaxID=3042722 RepID=UPI0024803B09|nr:hypothetical protein [Winogradskyella sp. SYSU M77433]MDH7912090.1 hypothetical protein [Winogradskyella sp. SYSU M77433]
MKFLAIPLILFSILFLTTKPIDLGKYTIEVEEVINRKTFWKIGSSVTAKNNHKYVGVKALFTPKNKKDNRLDVEDFTIKTDGEEYEMTIPKKQDVFYRGANMIKVRKPKKDL